MALSLNPENARPDTSRCTLLPMLLGTCNAQLRLPSPARPTQMLALVPAGQTVAPELLAFVRGETDALPEEMRTSWWAGTPEMVRERVRACIALGFTHFMLWFIDAPDDSGMRLFAEAVMPGFCVSS